jgi:hypothetical protein
MTQDQHPPEQPNSEPEPSGVEPNAVPDIPDQGIDEPLDVAFSEILEEDILEEEPAKATPSPRRTSPTTAEPSITERIQTTWNRVQPVLRIQSIRILRTGSQLLEGAAKKLEEGAPAPGATSDGILPPTTEIGSGGEVPPYSTEELQQKFRQFWEKVRPYWQKVQVWWANTLPKIRAILPESLNEKLSDRALTGAIAGILLLFLWIFSGSSSKPKPTDVAVSSPRTTKSTPAPKVKMPERPKPGSPKTSPTPVVQPSPSPSLSTPPSPSPLPSPSPPPSPPAITSSPSPPPPITPPSPPPPPLKLTPEQKLIARIQDQVAEISNQYVSGLIQFVQANFRVSRLTVKVGDGWYGLSEPQQDNLANEMLRRAQELNFSKLEITDPEAKLLARSPVVGTEMIILQRSQAKPVSPASAAIGDS